MTDTLKWLDEDEVVRGTADRETYRVLGSPQAYRRDALVDALSAAPDDVLRDRGTDVLPRLVLAGGARVALVRSPGESFRVQTEEDLVLVDALL